jgi:hypothetical protein
VHLAPHHPKKSPVRDHSERSLTAREQDAEAVGVWDLRPLVDRLDLDRILLPPPWFRSVAGILPGAPGCSTLSVTVITNSARTITPSMTVNGPDAYRQAIPSTAWVRSNPIGSAPLRVMSKRVTARFFSVTAGNLIQRRKTGAVDGARTRDPRRDRPVL